MSTLEDIENAVTLLSAEEQARFRDWFFEFDAQNWDEQIQKDADAGRLDQLAEQALDRLRESRCTPL